jgi:ubiquinone/menaquinone biosynthesis C-methylase UbiE
MYENGSLSLSTGGILRPGGWTLTKRMIEQCKLRNGDFVLDVGCGSGSTIRYLMENHPVHAIGLDGSKMLLRQGRIQNPNLLLARALGTTLPIADAQVDVVLSECSLSAMSGMEGFLAEAWRILCPGGRLAISDVYARNPDGTSMLRALPLTCGMRNASEQAKVIQSVQKHGFEILLWEDHSETLKELAMQITSTHGSLSAFWSQSEPEADSLDVAIAISKAKLGYFVLVAEKLPNVKGDNTNG